MLLPTPITFQIQVKWTDHTGLTWHDYKPSVALTYEAAVTALRKQLNQRIQRATTGDPLVAEYADWKSFTIR